MSALIPALIKLLMSRSKGGGGGGGGSPKAPEDPLTVSNKVWEKRLGGYIDNAPPKAPPPRKPFDGVLNRGG